MLQHITAQFKSTCSETSRPIKRGELCFYNKAARKIYHPDSPTGRAAEAASLDGATALMDDEETFFNSLDYNY